MPLGEVIKLDLDQVRVDPTKTYEMVGVYSFGKGLFRKESVQGINTSYKYFFRLKANHIVMSQLFGWEGALALSSSKFEGLFVSSQFPTFSCDEIRLDRHFLEFLMKRPSFWEDLGTRTKGMGGRRRTLNPNSLLQSIIPLPPLEEQRRIVARVEELVGKIEEVRSLRQKALEETEALMNSELLSICDKLIEKYGYQPLNELILDAGYGTSAKCEYERLKNYVPVLRIPNIVSERINFDDIKYGLLSATQLQRVLVTKGNLLVVRTNGSAELVGRCAVVPTLSEPTAFASYLIRLHCDHQQIDSFYLQLILRHLRTTGQLFDFARTTAGQYNLSLGRLRAVKLPVPPLAEQRSIVAYLDELQTKIDTIKQLRKEAIKELDAILPSILDKAFKGEL